MFSWDSLKLKPCDRDTTHSLSAKIGDSVHLQKGQESRGNRKLVTRSSLMVEGRCCCDSADWRQVCTADNLQSIKINRDKPINKYSYGLFVFKQELSVSSKTADMQEIFITWRILFSFNKYWINKHVFISLSAKIDFWLNTSASSTRSYKLVKDLCFQTVFVLNQTIFENFVSILMNKRVHICQRKASKTVILVEEFCSIIIWPELVYSISKNMTHLLETSLVDASINYP